MIWLIKAWLGSAWLGEDWLGLAWLGLDDTEEQESTRPGFYGLLKELETERSQRFMRHCQEPFVMPALCGHPPPPAMVPK